MCYDTTVHFRKHICMDFFFSPAFVLVLHFWCPCKQSNNVRKYWKRLKIWPLSEQREWLMYNKCIFDLLHKIYIQYSVCNLQEWVKGRYASCYVVGVWEKSCTCTSVSRTKSSIKSVSSNKLSPWKCQMNSAWNLWKVTNRHKFRNTLFFPINN